MAASDPPAEVRPRSTSLTAVAQALSELLGTLPPVQPFETPLSVAVGAVVADALAAQRAVPERALALRQGWAVAASEVVGASAYAPMPLGAAPAFVLPGDTLPPGADAVLPPDAVAVEAGWAQALAEAPPGAFVRRPGEDLGRGMVLLEAGVLVRPHHAALAELAGVKRCRVRRPILLIEHDGSEEGAAVARLVAGLAASIGAETQLAEARGRSDPVDAVALIGRGERAGPAMLDPVIADGLALRPGEAAACGLIGGVPAFSTPARAADALAVSLVLIRPVLARLAGAAEAAPRSRPLTRKLASTVGLTEIALLRETPAGFEPLGVADLTLAALARADAWLAVPPESEGCAAGEMVTGLAL